MTPLLHTQKIQGGDLIPSLQIIKVGGYIRKTSQPDNLTILIVDKSRMSRLISPVHPGMSVNIGEYLKQYLTLEIRDNIYSPTRPCQCHPPELIALLLKDDKVILTIFFKNVMGEKRITTALFEKLNIDEGHLSLEKQPPGCPVSVYPHEVFGILGKLELKRILLTSPPIDEAF